MALWHNIQVKKKNSPKFLKFTVIFLAAIFVFVGMSSLIFKLGRDNSPLPQKIRIGNTVIDLQLALTKTDQEIGLAKFSSLPENEGMLFIFNKPDTYSFWMKDMKFPIDIIWISEDFKIIHIEKSLSPDTYPQGYAPKDKALYVLEVNAGFSDTHSFTIGESVEFK